MRQAVPGYYPRWIKPGEAIAVVEEVCVTAYDFCLATGRDVPDATVEPVMRAIRDNLPRLVPIHPVFKEWTRERGASADATALYHQAAVRFFRERGVWTPEVEQAQQRLLAGSPR